MPNIQINIKDKVARADRAIIVCDNSDYTAVFDFDDEWSAYETKTARFAYCGKYTDVVFTGNSCPIPVIQDTRSLTIGVYAGDLHTTTPAYVSCVPSILCGNGIPADPTPDVYTQIMELLNKESGIWYPAVDDAGNMSWTRSISETEPQPVNIKGPKGDAGADGIGIPGADGKDGVDGKSAYELAQDNGFVGTMQEWLASLVGADGANGADGKDGISPAVSVAAITGGNRVTITDAEGAKTFDVMDGAQGASGADGKDYVLTNTDKQEIAKTAAGLVDVPSVQSDWNQNDSTQPDYIKNRPFYTGDPVETVLVEESTVSFSESRNGKYQGELLSTFSATVGETYKVYWDGTVYECTCVSFNNKPVIGNLSIPGAGSDTGEPFVMGILNGKGIQIVTADTSASHTVSISRFGPEVVKIDPKYIRDMYYTGDPVETVLVEESTVSFASANGIYMGQLDSTFSATVGETYKVYWDGTAYECACVNFNDNLVIGNLSVAGAGSDTGEPFLIVVNPGGRIEIGTADTSASHTVSISGLVSPIIKIDEKYLPNTIATKSEVEAAQTTASNAQTTASNAQTTANNAQTTASNAKSEALDLAARMFGHTSVVDSAFYKDKTLSITSLPACIESIGGSAFQGCTKLALTSLPSGITSIGNGAFQGCTNLALTSLPSGLTSIGFQVFNGCKNLALTSLPSGITSIDSYAFSGCTKLALTSLPSGLTSIGSDAFTDCPNLALTSLPSGITSIGRNTFFQCTKLALTSLPSGITSIGNSAFQSCTRLTSITFTGKPTTISSSAFKQCTNLTTINVPWAEGEVANAPWGATNATINYNYTGA